MNVRHFGAVVLLVALASGSVAGPRAQEASGRETRRPQGPVVGRSVVATTYGIVAASQPLAARAGVQILERGGNAIDAAIAANATIGLMEPTGNGIGGDLFSIYYEAKTRQALRAQFERLGADGPDRRFPRAKGVKSMPQRGIYSVTVPGVVAGWDAMRTKFGTKPFAELLAPAIYYAENGFPLSETIAQRLGELRQDAQRASQLAEDLSRSTARVRRRRARCSGIPTWRDRCG